MKRNIPEFVTIVLIFAWMSAITFFMLIEPSLDLLTATLVADVVGANVCCKVYELARQNNADSLWGN